MQCPSCDAEIPNDARFCIECGVTLGSATGPTVQPRAGEGRATTCAGCGASNPGHAIFCVRCGQRMGDPALLQTPPRQAIGGVGPGAPSLPTFSPRPQPSHGRQRDTTMISVALLLIGIGVLFLGKLFWPGILVVIGLANFVRLAGNDRVLPGVRNLLWFCGIAFLFVVPRLFLPGMLVLIGLNAMISGMIRSRRQWP
jgi:ribosomal protein L40E